MKNRTIVVTLSLLTALLMSCGPRVNEGTVPYAPQPWPARVWASEVPTDCPFERSKDIVAVAFTRNTIAYTDADTRYPSWAPDGNMYSGWTDGEIGEESVHSNGPKARTGNARIEGDDPLRLTVTSLGSEAASPAPYGGRYPSANLVHDGIWYYGTYAVDFDMSKPEYRDLYSWAICGPLPGFRISKDYGRTWIPSPLSPEKPLFPESGKDGRSAWLSYSANFHKSYFGNRTVADPMGSRYAWTLHEVRLLDAPGLAALSEATAKAPEDRLKSEANLALRARVNVSSVHTKNRPFTELIEYFGEGAVDGVVDPDEAINRREWVSLGERQTSMIRLSWDSPQTARRVWLFDRPNPKDHIVSGVLLFSDGSVIRVGELPNHARSAREIVFPAKTISWVVFAVDTVSPETANAGLAEMAVFKD